MPAYDRAFLDKPAEADALTGLQRRRREIGLRYRAALADAPVTFIPDEIPDPSVLDGLPGHLHMELQVFGEAPVVRDLDFVVSAVNTF